MKTVIETVGMYQVYTVEGREGFFVKPNGRGKPFAGTFLTLEEAKYAAEKKTLLRTIKNNDAAFHQALNNVKAASN